MSQVTPISVSSVRAVDRALDILLCLSRAEGGLSLSAVAKQVDLHKSTVHRLLLSMQSKGFVRKHAHNDLYLLGWSVLELLGNVYQSDELSAIALPEMNQLREITGETISLYIRTGVERIRIQSVESLQPIRNVAHIGKTYPLYIGASGKVLLAFADEDTIRAVVEDHRIPPDFDRNDLFSQLQSIRQEGFAISQQERDDGAASISAPIFGRSSNVLAALSVSGPVERLTREKMDGFVEPVKRSAAFLSKLLSH